MTNDDEDLEELARKASEGCPMCEDEDVQYALDIAKRLRKDGYVTDFNAVNQMIEDGFSIEEAIMECTVWQPGSELCKVMADRYVDAKLREGMEPADLVQEFQDQYPNGYRCFIGEKPRTSQQPLSDKSDEENEEE